MNAIKVATGKEVSGGYDLTLLHDMTDDGEGTPWYEVFAVGEIPELAAGIIGGAVSPWFKTPEEAWAWAADNEAFIRGMYDAES